MSSTTRVRTIAVSLAAVLALGGLAACGSDSGTSSSSATTTGSGTLAVTGAWARESAMATGNGAVYFTITNGGTAEDTLLSASVSADVAAQAQIHETMQTTDTTGGGMPGSTDGAMSGNTVAGSGMMTMQEVESVAVPAGETVMFAPGGYHVMLIELVTPLEVGRSVPVTLTFAKAGDVQIDAQVRAS